MSVPLPLLINLLNFLLITIYVVFCLCSEVFLAGLQQEASFSEAKTKVSDRCRLNYILPRFQNILTFASWISCVNTGFGIANKECHTN